MPTPPRSSLALRTIDLLAGLPDERLDRLAQACAWHTVAARRPLLLRTPEGAPPAAEPAVYFVVSGRLRADIHSAGGRQVTFRDHGPGECFGELAAIDGGPRSAEVRALEDSVVASLDRAGFLALLRDEPQVAERMLQRLAAWVRQLSDRVVDLSTLPVPDRLRIELLRLAREAGVAANRARLDPAPRHALLAGRISTNREQVTRELAALGRAGLVRKEGGALWVEDVDALARRVADARDGVG